MTTLVSFVNALEAMAVTGVTTSYTQGQPSTLNTADLPALWVDRPRIAFQPSTTTGGDMDVTLTADVLIALEPVGQNRRPVNFDAVVAMQDALLTALVTFDTTRTLMGRSTGSAQLIILTINTVDYWGIQSTISGLG